VAKIDIRVVNNDIRGLLNSVEDGSTSAFMWEWFTTKPFVDAGEGRFVGFSKHNPAGIAKRQ